MTGSPGRRPSLPAPAVSTPPRGPPGTEIWSPSPPCRLQCVVCGAWPTAENVNRATHGGRGGGSCEGAGPTKRRQDISTSVSSPNVQRRACLSGGISFGHRRADGERRPRPGASEWCSSQGPFQPPRTRHGSYLAVPPGNDVHDVNPRSPRSHPWALGVEAAGPAAAGRRNADLPSGMFTWTSLSNLID